jgi:7-keto-8-aminopelargonate synthetase-like enzyme
MNKLGIRSTAIKPNPLVPNVTEILRVDLQYKHTRRRIDIHMYVLIYIHTGHVVV